MNTLGNAEWAEILACLLIAALIVWKQRTLSECIWWLYAHATFWTVTLPTTFVGLAIFLYWHFFGWHLPWRGL